jgi:hypothetical protein
MSKAINVVPTEESFRKIDQIKKQLHVSRARFCVISLEFILPLIESGAMVLQNGKLVLAKRKPKAEKAA